MSVSLKLRQLESKISTLQSHHQTLLKERHQEIAALMTSLDLAQVEDNILLGALLFLKNKISTKDPTGLALVEAWRDAGDRFLRRSKSKKQPPTLPLETATAKSKPSQKSS
ncbi:MAG: hypothetical protein K2X02_05820 [Alphaproteobacteria bacterium]|nr:hypothetical protein [Alphaproteobacteria bacterium]